jgi:hypothetical protein
MEPTEKPIKSCWEEQADLNEALANALKADDTKKADTIELKLRELDCNHDLLAKYGDSADRNMLRAHDSLHHAIVHRILHHVRHHHHHHDGYGDLALMSDADDVDVDEEERRHQHLQSLLHDHRSYLRELNRRHDDRSRKTTVKSAQKCVEDQANLNELLGKALKHGNDKIVARLQDELAGLKCDSDESDSAICEEKKNAAHKKTAALNLKLVTAYNKAALCTGDNAETCQGESMHQIHKLKRDLEAVQSVVC